MRKKKKSMIYNITTKNIPIRVLYKKTNKIPEIKIINNVSKLKKAIIKNNLDIIPYENVFIICCNQKLTTHTSPNIVLPLKSIYGDLMIIRIDRKKREFKGLTQEDIMWYTQDLINKKVNTNYTKPTKTQHLRKNKNFYEHSFVEEISNKEFNFEKSLIDVLVNIELVLASILKNGEKSENE